MDNQIINKKSKMLNNQNLKLDHNLSEVSFLSILLIIARQLKIIILIPLLFSVYAIIYVTFFTEPSYEAYIKFITKTKSNTPSNASNLAAQFGISLNMNQVEAKWNYREILTSRTIARQMLRRKFDTDKYGLQKTLLQIMTFPESNINNILESKAVDNFIKKINFSENKKTGVGTLKMSSFEPSFSVSLINVLIEELESHQKKYSRETNSKARVFIEGRISAIGKELSQAENKLKDFTISNRRMENSPLLLLERDRINRDVSVLTSVYTVLKSQLENTKIEEVKESEFILILDPAEEPIFKSAPIKRTIVLKFGIVGLLLGLAIGFIKEYVSSNFKQVLKLSKLIYSNIK